MSRATLLARGRAAAEAGMVDACVITRVSRSTDTTTGEVTDTATELYDGRCRVQQSQAQAQREDVGEDRLLLLRLEVQLPIDGTDGLQVGDVITITAAEHDPDLPGRVFRVHGLAHATHKTARRVQCVEETGS